MNESPRFDTVEATSSLEALTRRVQQLYPSIQEIQFFLDHDKRVTFWVVCRPGAEAVPLSVLQQSIMSHFAENGHGLKCSIHAIHSVTRENILHPKDAGKQYIRTVCQRVEAVFVRDDIRVVFDNGICTVYGAAPRDQGRIHAEVLRHMFHMVPVKMEFRARIDGEAETTKSVLHHTHEGFENTNIPHASSMRPSLLSLMFGGKGRMFFH